MDLLGVVIIDGFPASVRAENSKRGWIAAVAAAARPAFQEPLASSNLFVKVIVFYSPARQRFDIHNMAKPIFDALKGVAYNDDEQIRKTEQSKLPVGGAYRLGGIDGGVIERLAERREFVYLSFTNSLTRRSSVYERRTTRAPKDT